MRLPRIVTAFFVLFGATSAYAQNRPANAAACNLPHASGVSSERLMSGQQPRTYRLFVPPGYDGHQRLPLVLDLHGSGGTSAGEAKTSGFEDVAATEHFIVASLDAVDKRWNFPVLADRPDDVAYASDVIDQISRNVCVDAARIYSTGMSGGARMTSLLGCKLGSRLAAIAPVSGLRLPAASGCTGGPMPVLTFHGLADPQNPYAGHVQGRNDEWIESVPDALDGWARRDGCKAGAILEDPPGPLSTMHYDGCKPGSEVRIIRIDGLGHQWTHNEVDTTAVMWQFFKSHALNIGGPDKARPTSSTSSASAGLCEGLRNLMLPNTTIESATSVPTGPFEVPGAGAPRGGGPPQPPATLPAHCRVVAVLAPSPDSHIVVELWMPPMESWNGKFEAVGNGGWAGNITYGNGRPEAIPKTMASSLNAGYATASTDTGHVNDGTQARFALGHPEKLIDFAYRAVHEMTVTSKAVIAAYYGSGPKLSYWNGCSSGGRQALIEAQRFPNDFDGIAAGASANYWTHVMAGVVAAGQATHEGQPGNIPKEKLQVLHDAVIAACDGNDGVKDGLITDPMKCTFDVKTVACKGAESASCLTDAQVAAAQAMYAGAINPKTHAQVFTGVAFGSEMGWDPKVGLQPFPIGESYFKDVIYKDPNWDYRTLNLDKGVTEADSLTAKLMNGIDPNLKPFFDHGGKLLQYHGWNDQQVSPFNSVSYYNSVVKKLGHDAVDKNYRLFMEPGMMHCGGGDGPNQFDVMAVLEKWREGNIVPDQIVATHATRGTVDMSRPLCPYPQVAAYKGSGSTNAAENFTCK